MSNTQKSKIALGDDDTIVFTLGVMDRAAIRLLPDSLIAGRLATALRDQADSLEANPEKIRDLVKFTVHNKVQGLIAQKDDNVIAISDGGRVHSDSNYEDKYKSQYPPLWVKLHDGTTRLLVVISEDEAASRGLKTSL